MVFCEKMSLKIRQQEIIKLIDNTTMKIYNKNTMNSRLLNTEENDISETVLNERKEKKDYDRSTEI